MAVKRAPLSRLLLICLACAGLWACASHRPANSSGVTDREAGFGAGTFAELDRLFQEQESRGAITGGALVVRREGRLVYRAAFGRCSDERGARRVTATTLFDVASLTKALAGGPVALDLQRRRVITFPTSTQIARLAMHVSGLNDEVDYPRLDVLLPKLVTADGESLHRLLAEDFPEAFAGRHEFHRYSNTGYVILALLAAAEKPNVEGVLREEYWAPLGVTRMSFRPDGEESIAASGRAQDGRLLVGEPYDPKAAYLLASGGIVPLHSGLFADAEEVSLFADGLLAASEGSGMEHLRNSLFGQTMEFGRSGGGGISVSCGGLESPRTLPFAPDGTRPGRIYFQTGYTGCLLWVDTQSGTSVALLTNASLTNRLDEWESFSEDVVMAMLRGLKKGP
jgi:CubicO group peptidase (beta-lactamase class C family)